MMNYRKGDIIVTAFPFAETGQIKKRPALIMAGPFQEKEGVILYWALMITSTILKGWKGDVEIPKEGSVGLPIKSIIRTTKIACIDVSMISKKIGVLDTKTQELVQKKIDLYIQ